MESKKGVFMILCAAVLLIVACNSKTSQESPPATLTSALPQQSPEPSPTTGDANIIEITNAGFSPAQITIDKGASVTFVNKGTAESWPASAQHPTHQVYPGSDIKKCNTPEQSSIFDACRGLQQGESWSFTFNVAGNWKYHDHLNPGLRGEVSVI